jgi:hypothetical protein
MSRALQALCPIPLMLVTMLALPGVLSAQVADFNWRGRVPAGQTLEIRGIQGEIRAELAAGDQIEVVARRHARRDDPAAVSVEVVPHAGGVTICALYPTPDGNSRRNSCGPGEAYTMNSGDSDVRVDFTVKLPAGVRLAAVNVTGDIHARQLRSHVSARTVTGDVTLSTSEQATARTVTGAVDVSIGTVGTTGVLEFKTVTGDITLQLPAGAGASVRLSTVSGSFQSDFPVAVNGAMTPRRLQGDIGAGGARLELGTVSGDIRLRRGS